MSDTRRIEITTSLPHEDTLTVEIEKCLGARYALITLTEDHNRPAEVWLFREGVDQLIFTLTAIRDFVDPTPEEAS